MAFLCRAVGLGVKYWEIIANKIMNAGFSVGWVSAIDQNGRTVRIVDAHRRGGNASLRTRMKG
jgi:hypothetical protein